MSASGKRNTDPRATPRAEDEIARRHQDAVRAIQSDPEAVAALASLRDASRSGAVLPLPSSALEEAREIEAAERRRKRKPVTAPGVTAPAAVGLVEEALRTKPHGVVISSDIAADLAEDAERVVETVIELPSGRRSDTTKPVLPIEAPQTTSAPAPIHHDPPPLDPAAPAETTHGLRWVVLLVVALAGIALLLWLVLGRSNSSASVSGPSATSAWIAAPIPSLPPESARTSVMESAATVLSAPAPAWSSTRPTPTVSLSPAATSRPPTSAPIPLSAAPTLSAPPAFPSSPATTTMPGATTGGFTDFTKNN